MRTLALVVLSLVSCGCDAFEAYRRAKQIRTRADLQTISMRIELARSEDSNRPLASLEGLLHEINGGRDAWGEPILFVVREAPGAAGSYLLVSKGADRELDLERVEEYFDASEELVGGQADRDLVFRDGLPVKNAGK